MSDILDDIDDELEAVAESKCGPIFEGIKNVYLLGRAHKEIERLRNRLVRIATTSDDQADHLRWLAADALRGLRIGEGR